MNQGTAAHSCSLVRTRQSGSEAPGLWEENSVAGRVLMALRAVLHMQVSALQGQGAMSQLAAGVRRCLETPRSC